MAGTTTLGVNNSTFSDSKFNAGLRLRGEGPSVMNATVQNSTFSLNADPGFSMQTDAANTAQQTLLLTANSFSGGSANAVSGRPQISINSNSGADGEGHDQQQPDQARRRRRDHRQLPGRPDRRGQPATPRSIGNTINDAQPGALDAPADGGSSIWGWAHGDGATRMEVRNNVVANYGGRAMELSHNDGNGTADFTVTGNTFSTPDVTPNTFEGMYILSGGAGGDASNVCVDLENNDFDGIGRQGVSDLAIDRVPRYVPAIRGLQRHLGGQLADQPPRQEPGECWPDSRVVQQRPDGNGRNGVHPDVGDPMMSKWTGGGRRGW